MHAVRNLLRIGFGTTAVRWAQLGYGRTSSTSTQQVTARNLFGFKDGTNNLKAEEPDLLDEHVWVQKGDGPDWMTGGTYLVARRIRMHIETWDRAPLDEQELVVGRTKGNGAPLGGTGEFEPANYRSIDANGTPVIPVNSHIRLASAESLNGIKILRRGFNFVAGADDRGHLNAGLFFICFVRNPQTQFVPMQRMLAANDTMMDYIQHTGSAVFACPPGLREGEYWGQQLLRARLTDRAEPQSPIRRDEEYNGMRESGGRARKRRRNVLDDRRLDRVRASWLHRRALVPGATTSGCCGRRRSASSDQSRRFVFGLLTVGFRGSSRRLDRLDRRCGGRAARFVAQRAPISPRSGEGRGVPVGRGPHPAA